MLSPALITQTVIANGIDYGGGDMVAVYSDTTGYRIIDAPRDAGLTIIRSAKQAQHNRVYLVTAVLPTPQIAPFRIEDFMP